MLVIKRYEEVGRSPQVGDRVKIVDRPASFHWASRMDKWLSSIMTVREVGVGILKMKEDYNDFNGNLKPGWDWYMVMIEGVVIETAEDILEDPSIWASGDELDILLT